MTPSSSFLPAAEDKQFYVSETPLDIIGLLNESHHPAAGALVLFSGEVRNMNSGKEVAYLEYEAHAPMATKMIRTILAEAKARWKLSVALACHRTGRVSVSETAVVVITAAPHRAEAYAANRYIIDRIKHEVPIWKCEYYADGTKEWGGNCNCHQLTGNINEHIYESEIVNK